MLPTGPLEYAGTVEPKLRLASLSIPQSIHNSPVSDASVDSDMSAMAASLEFFMLYHKSFLRGILGVSLHVVPTNHGICFAIYVASFRLPLHDFRIIQGLTHALDRVWNAEGNEDHPADANEKIDR